MASKILIRGEAYIIRVKFNGTKSPFDAIVPFETVARILVEGGVEPPSELHDGDAFALVGYKGKQFGTLTVRGIQEMWRAV